MTQKRLKTLNLCDRSVEHLKTKHEGQSSFARKAILMHDPLIDHRDKAILQENRDFEAIRFLSNVIREVYLNPEEATLRIEIAFQMDSKMIEWYRKDEEAGKGLKWFWHRCRAVLAGVRL